MSLPALKLYHKQPYPAISPTRPEISQAGRTVVVSGGSSGIGFAIARSFATAGAKRVIILGRRRETAESAAAKLNSDAGRDVAKARIVDAYHLPDIERLWSDLKAEGIYVDVLVLSAAAYGKKAPILDASLEDTWRDYEANVRAPLAMTLSFSKQTTGRGKRSDRLPALSPRNIY
jgi:NAD(P)-dependent dehydrogenase (short-subunit alcohol dehydrogenase family)